jgi:hypothetical protein
MRERTYTPGVELEDSHFLSAGIYRILRDDREESEPLAPDKERDGANITPA